MIRSSTGCSWTAGSIRRPATVLETSLAKASRCAPSLRRSRLKVARPAPVSLLTCRQAGTTDSSRQTEVAKIFFVTPLGRIREGWPANCDGRDSRREARSSLPRLPRLGKGFEIRCAWALGGLCRQLRRPSPGGATGAAAAAGRASRRPVRVRQSATTALH